MYIGDGAAGDADIEDLDCVGRDAVRERGGGALVEGDCTGGARVANPICYMVIGLHILRLKQNQETKETRLEPVAKLKMPTLPTLML